MKLREHREIVANRTTTIYCKKDRYTYKSTYTLTIVTPARTVRSTCKDRKSTEAELIKVLLREGWKLSDIRKL